jgi:hypothetical protein
MVGRSASGTHWWLRDKDGRIIDATAEQFTSEGLEPPYANVHGTGFLTKKPSKRAQAIIDRLASAG